MFNDRPYAEINREERFFCSLLAHALLATDVVRRRFLELLAMKTGARLDPEHLEVFIEAAALRDYWNDLGDPSAYSDDTHGRRRVVLDLILGELGVPAQVLDEHPLFWTFPERKKLWSPGRWEEKALREAGLDGLVDVKWAFNAKPDMMLASPGCVVFVEAKLESGEGRSGAGYEQFQVQKLTARLLRVLSPAYSRCTFHTTVLALRPTSGIAWSDVLSSVEGAPLDEFTARSLRGLERFYRGGAHR
jgi:hypothetical protein